jgi:RimJ/RimL family protein N-acetyltransferase
MQPMPDLTPVILEGRHVRLEPLSREHRTALARVAFDADLWRFTPTQIHTDDDLDTYIETAMSEQKAGTTIPFAIIDRSTGLAIGSTRFGALDAQHRRAEIGWTWLGRAYQRKAFNTEAKMLMLTHAFEQMGCIRIEFKVDVLNERSRTAVARLGAKEEGTLRHHMILPDGRLIDWVFYSILQDEWPSVRAGLEQKLASHDA